MAAASSRRLRSLSPCSRMWSTAAASSLAFGDRAGSDSVLSSLPERVYHLVHVPGGTDRRPSGGTTMAEQEISVRAWTPASPAEVYRLLRDGATWPVWSPLDSFELEREGAEGGESLGAHPDLPHRPGDEPRGDRRAPTGPPVQLRAAVRAAAARLPRGRRPRAAGRRHRDPLAQPVPRQAARYRSVVPERARRSSSNAAPTGSPPTRPRRRSSSTLRVASRAWPPCDRRRLRIRTR